MAFAPKTFLFFLAVFLAAGMAFAETPKDSSFLVSDHTFSWVGILLPHHSLRNSKSLHNWPFFGFAAPTWSFKYKAQKDLNKLVAFKGEGEFVPGFAGLALKLDASLELIHLLEVGVTANTGTALNYGNYATFMGVYNPKEKDYDANIFFTEYAYGLRYHGAITIPLMVFLPKGNWTKIILKGTGDLIYSGYTGARDGQVWKAGSENSANAYKFNLGTTLIYMLPFQRVPMAMVSANVGGFLRDDDFDEVYKDYNPNFKTVNVTPMVSIKISENWNGTLMAPITRERKFENSHYETTEELLQKQVGTQWNLKAVMFIATKKF